MATPTLNQVLQAARDLSVMIGTVLAALWFIYTRRHKRRVSFQIDCAPLPIFPSGNQRGVELRFMFENQGERQQTLNRIVYTLDAPIPAASRPDVGQELSESDWKRIVSGALQPRQIEDAPHIRAGTQHMLTECVAVPINVRIVRITARLDWFRDQNDPGAKRNQDDRGAETELLYPARATTRRYFALPEPESLTTNTA